MNIESLATVPRRIRNRIIYLFSPGSPWRYSRKILGYLSQPREVWNRWNIGQELRSDPEVPRKNLAELDESGYSDVTAQLDQELTAELLRAADVIIGRGIPKDPAGARAFFRRLLTPDDNKIDSVFVRYALQEKFLRLASAYFGQVPKLSNISLAYSIVWDKPEWEESQLWHRDLNDDRVLKLFVYLNDVSESRDGPFTYLPADISQQVKHHLIHRRITDQQMESQGKAQYAKEVLGKKGSAFFIDTGRCYHLGSRCRAKPRAAFVVMYTTVTEMTCYAPVTDPGTARLSPLQELFVRVSRS